MGWLYPKGNTLFTLRNWGNSFVGKMLAIQVLGPEFGPQHHHEKLYVLVHFDQLLASVYTHMHTQRERGEAGAGQGGEQACMPLL